MTTEIEQTENYDAPERDIAVSYPEYGPLPEARISLNFTPGKAPQLTVRAHTAVELISALQELGESNAYNAIGLAHASMGAEASIGAGLGPTTRMPEQAGPPAPQGAPTPPPFGPNVSVPQAPGYAGPPQAPMPPQAPAPQWGGQQQGGAQGNRGPKPRPAEWPVCFRIEVPFQAKDQFKQFREQYKDAFRGKVFWAGGGGYWVHGDIVQSFAQYNPTPA